MRQGPLAGRYPAVATMVMFALIPYLALSAALEPLTPIIAKDLHMSLQTMSLELGPGQRRLRGRHGAGGPVRPAPAAAQDAGRLRGAARDRLGAGRRGAGPGHVHRRPRAAGPVHEPAADRRRAAAGDRLSGRQAAHDGDDHEHVHLRRGRARPGDRRPAGAAPRLAAAVLDRRRDRRCWRWCWRC